MKWIRLSLLHINSRIWLTYEFPHKCYATIDYINRVVRFQFPNELELRWKGRGSNPTSQIVSNLKETKMVSKRLNILFLSLDYV